MRLWAVAASALCAVSCWTAQGDDRCTGVAAVSASFYQTYAVKTDGSPWAWGDWPNGPTRPARAPHPASATGVATRGCFVSGDAYDCWLMTVPAGALQVDISVFPDDGGPNYCIVGANHDLTCVLENQGAPGVVATGIAQVAVGVDHFCAIRVDGTVFCQYVSSGDPSGDSAGLWPGDLPTLGTDVVSLASSAQSACALRGDGTVWCWGRDRYGNAQGSLATATPTMVDALGSDVTSIGMGASMSCALKRDGTLWCWGDMRQLYMSNFAPPAPVAGLPSPVTAFSVGDVHTCAVAGGGQLFCWGNDSFGELGDGNVGDAAGEVPQPQFSVSDTPPTPVPVLGCP